MTTLVASSPVLNDTIFCDDNGNPLSGGFIYTYVGGTWDAPQITYAESTGTTENTNPIELDSAGRMTTGLWLEDGFTYNFTLTDAFDTVIKSFENIQGCMPAPLGGSVGTAVWIPAPVLPNYVSATQFTLEGLYADTYTVGGRVRYQFSDLSYAYGTISAVEYFSPVTQITFVPDSGPYTSDVVNVASSAAVYPNAIVDAGAVSVTDSLTYDLRTVGGRLQSINSNIQTRGVSYPAVLGGTIFTVSTGYTTPTYDGMVLDVIFDAAISSAVSINVNNIGNISLKMVDYTGAFINPVITAGMCSRIMYNGTDMVLLDQLPYTPVAPPSAQKTLVTTYLNTALGIGSTWSIPTGTVSVYMVGQAAGTGNTGDQVGVQIIDSGATVLTTLPVHGTNFTNGVDGGSGMWDNGASSLPISSTAASLKLVSLSGSNGTGSARIYAYTQFI